jgi:small-conductance mechanosensitive channel
MNDLVSQTTFAWCLTILVVGVCAPWLVYDIRNLSRALRADGGDPVVRDKRFGYAIGITIAVIGIVGSLRFQGVF